MYAGGVLAVVAFAGTHPPVGGPWLWWRPPATASASERLGLRTSQIARLSEDEWNRLNQRAAVDGRGSVGDAAADVYGVALRAENRREARRRARRATLERIREASFRYGMACIALEDTLAGGGTYSIHVPHEMFIESERLIRALIREQAAPKTPAKALAEVSHTLETCRTTKVAPPMALRRKGESSRLHRYAAYALAYRRELDAAKLSFEPRVRANVDRYVVAWGRDYLATRGAPLRP